MKLPKMILFDYGHTLGYEEGFDGVKGNTALMKHVVKNRFNKSAEEVQALAMELTKEIHRHTNHAIEIHWNLFDRLFYDRLGIELDLPISETDKIFWDNAAPAVIMPDTDKMIDYINSRGIRSGVISNISFSGAAVTDRINALLPNNKFEFIMTSSEYVFRKPHRYIFETAIIKSGLNPDEIWFCGDNPTADVIGASNAGMYPVWYTSNLECTYRDESYHIPPDCEHLHIHEWSELVDTLKKLT